MKGPVQKAAEKKEALQMLQEKKFTKKQLEWLLCSTLIEGGVSLYQIKEIFEDWTKFLVMYGEEQDEH